MYWFFEVNIFKSPSTAQGVAISYEISYPRLLHLVCILYEFSELVWRKSWIRP